MSERKLSRNEARKLLSAFLVKGAVTFTTHAKKRMVDHDMTAVDVANVLRCGKILSEAECEGDEWRYRLETDRMVVVVAIYEERSEVRIITAWRKKK